MPDVSEGDQSIKYDRAAISRYIASLTLKLNPPVVEEVKQPSCS